MSDHGTYTTVDGRPALRFDRRLAQPVEVVWRAITDPAELRHWFPCEVELELREGGAMRFDFGGEVEYAGEVTALDPPRLLAFSWGPDRLRFELAPDGDGTRLTLSHVLYEEGEEAAARTMSGWHVCLDVLAQRLAGEPLFDEDAGRVEGRARYAEYVAAGVPHDARGVS